MMMAMTETSCQIQVVDPQGVDALARLYQAAMEAGDLYPEMHNPDDHLPTDPPTPPVGIYLIVYDRAKPVGRGALRPIDESTAEVGCMYVVKDYRRHSVARVILEALEREAARLQYTLMRLETGNRQTVAMRLYKSDGFTQIPAFGPYVDDPISVCYEKVVQSSLSKQKGPVQK